MSVKDMIKKSVLESGAFTNYDVPGILTALAAALLLGALIYLVYRKFYAGVVFSRTFAVTLVGMTVLTCMVTLAISSNIVISLGMVGALSIVRFRTAIKDPMDLLYLFWAITSGITAGAGMYALTLLIRRAGEQIMAHLYNEETISKEINTKWAGKTVHFAKETDSTNEWCKRMSKENAEHGTLAVAEFQSAGKGRLGRKWTAPEGSSVMMSILLKPEFEAQYASMLTLVMGLSVAQAVCELGVEVSIKWPNDVVVSHKKICGILTEMGVQDGKIREVVIGVGLNVNLKEIQDELKDKATSLYLETGKTYDRNRLIGLVMEKFEINYEKFVQTCDLSMMLDDYNMLLANKSQPVRVLDKISPYEGVALEIDKDGALLVRVQSGEIRKVCSGEVSVRGLYSYI